MKMKRMKPISRGPRIVRLAKKIRSEEALLEILGKETPEVRRYFFDQLAPHLPFKLSSGFNPDRLSEMPGPVNSSGFDKNISMRV
jgi:hypothetical protein